MMMPRVYRRSLFDDLFEDFGSGFFSGPGRRPARLASGSQAVQPAGSGRQSLMKTDINELEDAFQLDIDMPGWSKDDVKAQIKDGYLVISAEKTSENEENDEAGKCIRRERYSGSMARSFFIGEGISEEDISAKFENGVLTIKVPKTEQKKVDEPKYIMIEG